MVADFRQFYGIDLPVEEPDEWPGLARHALLWSALPRESRCARRLATDCEWGPAEHLLRQVEYDLRVLCWQNTEDGHRGRNRPQPLQTPSERAGNRRRADAALARRDEIAAAFGIE